MGITSKEKKTEKQFDSFSLKSIDRITKLPLECSDLKSSLKTHQVHTKQVSKHIVHNIYSASYIDSTYSGSSHLVKFTMRR